MTNVFGGYCDFDFGGVRGCGVDNRKGEKLYKGRRRLLRL